MRRFIPTDHNAEPAPPVGPSATTSYTPPATTVPDGRNIEQYNPGPSVVDTTDPGQMNSWWRQILDAYAQNPANNPPARRSNHPSGFSGLGNTDVFDRIMRRMEPAFQQRSRDYVDDAMAYAGFLGGNRYGTFGMRESGRQGQRAALESQALFQPLLMQQLGLNLDLAGLNWDIGRYAQDRTDRVNAQYWAQMMDLLGIAAPPGQYPPMTTPSSPGAIDWYLVTQAFANR